MRLSSLSIRIAAGLLAVSGLAACGGNLSDQAYNYCINQATAAELDAAAEALNIAPDADRDFETGRDRSDPIFQRVCEYAWTARNGDLDVPLVQPGITNPTAPLDPQRSEDATLPPSLLSPSS